MRVPQSTNRDTGERIEITVPIGIEQACALTTFERYR
jgi:hypothetical protein